MRTCPSSITRTATPLASIKLSEINRSHAPATTTASPVVLIPSIDQREARVVVAVHGFRGLEGTARCQPWDFLVGIVALVVELAVAAGGDTTA